ncbi:MAG: hypothetical protein K6G15_00990 [Desulfovibrio sp.]|nr:hypothetical protein [Desulfovibrio sp.]
MKLSINEEIVVLCTRVCKVLDPKFDIHELAPIFYGLIAKHGGLSDIIGTVGSWGDTLPDKEIVFLVADYIKAVKTNRQPTIYQQILCPSDCTKVGCQEKTPGVSPNCVFYRQ